MIGLLGVKVRPYLVDVHRELRIQKQKHKTTDDDSYTRTKYQICMTMGGLCIDLYGSMCFNF